MKINLSNPNNYLSTLFGSIVAVAMAWVTIDWDHFELTKNNVMKLILSAVVAIGGYKTTINTRKNKE